MIMKNKIRMELNLMTSTIGYLHVFDFTNVIEKDLENLNKEEEQQFKNSLNDIKVAEKQKDFFKKTFYETIFKLSE